MKSPEEPFECETPAGVTEPAKGQYSYVRLSAALSLPEPLGVNAAAAAAPDDIPTLLTGCATARFGVKEGDSTLRLFLGLTRTQHIYTLLPTKMWTNMTSPPFVAIDNDPKSWFHGHVPVPNISEPHSSRLRMAADLLGSCDTAGRSYTASQALFPEADSHIDWAGRRKCTSSHLQTCVARSFP